MNKVLLYFVMKYSGNWDEIFNALKKKEKIDLNSYNDLENYSKKYITIIDNNYPEILKTINKPPFLFFYSGKTELLKETKILVLGFNKEISQYINSKFAMLLTTNDLNDCKTINNGKIIFDENFPDKVLQKDNLLYINLHETKTINDHLYTAGMFANIIIVNKFSFNYSSLLIKAIKEGKSVYFIKSDNEPQFKLLRQIKTISIEDLRTI